MVRFKNRYYLVELQFSAAAARNFSSKRLVEALKLTIKKHHGDFGLGSVMASLSGLPLPNASIIIVTLTHDGCFSVKYFNTTTLCAVIRCSKDYEAILTTALPLLRAIGKEACRLQVLRVAGTIKTCQRALKEHSEKRLVCLLADAQTEAERSKLISLVNNHPMNLA
eukprot:m.175865 g.175865  ORF g.175865 m.175865 type:complete len:167 (+) comp16791_c0_seq10:1718-2218(+)